MWRVEDKSEGETKMTFEIGKDDEITFQLNPDTREIDMFVKGTRGEMTLRFLELEAVDLFSEALERIKFSFKPRKKEKVARIGFEDC
jgi:hypothetical protein